MHDAGCTTLPPRARLYCCPFVPAPSRPMDRLARSATPAHVPRSSGHREVTELCVFGVLRAVGGPGGGQQTGSWKATESKQIIKAWLLPDMLIFWTLSKILGKIASFPSFPRLTDCHGRDAPSPKLFLTRSHPNHATTSHTDFYHPSQRAFLEGHFPSTSNHSPLPRFSPTLGFHPHALALTLPVWSSPAWHTARWEGVERRLFGLGRRRLLPLGSLTHLLTHLPPDQLPPTHAPTPGFLAILTPPTFLLVPLPPSPQLNPHHNS